MHRLSGLYPVGYIRVGSGYILIGSGYNCRSEVDEVERSELSASLTCLLTVKFLVLMLMADVCEVDGLMSVKLWSC